MPPASHEKTSLLQQKKPVASLEDPQHSEGATLWELRTLLIPYFWPKTWGLRLRVFISFSFLFLSRGSRILAPLFLKEATNVLSESQLTRVPVFAIGMYCATQFVFAAAKQLQTYLFMVVKQHAYQDVAAKLFGHLHSLSMNYHLTKKTGKVLRCLDRGSTSTDNIVNVIFFRLLPTLVELVVVSIVFIFSFKEKILSVVTIIGVVLYVIITGVGTRIRLQFKKQTNEHDNKASEKAVDSLVNFETVKYFCTEDYELTRYMSSIFLFQKSQLSTRGLMNAIVVAQQVIQQTCLGTCLLITARNIFRGSMTVGDFVAVTVYISNIYKPLDSLGNIYNTIVQSFVDMENLVELLRIQPEVQDKPGAPALEVATNASTVSFHNVCFRYPSQPVANGLKGVTFTVPTGQTVAIVGSTGSGKTTISRLLFRFYDVVSGKICINGQDIASVRQKSLRQSIGIVPQDTVMFNDSIRYNLTYGRRHCTDEELVAAVKVANIYDFIMSLPNQFDAQIGERGLKLSGGEKQRIAIARLVLKNPSVVVLDEATSSLDTVTEQSIHEALDVACKGRTTIIIAHRLSTVRHADNIVVIEKGSVVESGSHSQLLAQQGRYLQLWTQQSRETEPNP
ncbi:hypothetical protein PHYBOEH_001589 [Phytophthora boehmeriae]|uniref:ATP-binding Cassette (ABC) Superfamily n=1 Tax=Phytophthora boehmeriae TaxID=109152 RepID=A0A8T1WYV7_9STRA|nr:hypothetical protein PHYBOEH_001589 [Phytophthora boehmeriae]